MENTKNSKIDIFENKPIPKALTIMAIPTVMSQLIALIYNIADTWFIGQTNNPYMVAATSLSATVFLMMVGISNLFGAGGGNCVVSLLGKKQEDEAGRVASLSLVMAAGSALLFSLLCFIFLTPLLRLLGASENTMDYAKQYLFFVVILGSLPSVLSNTMSFMLRNIGYSKEAAFGLGFGGILNVVLDPIFMFVLMPEGCQVMGAAIATLLSNIAAFVYYIWVYVRVKNTTILAIPHSIEKITSQSMRAIFGVGLPAALGLIFYDLSNIVINKLSSAHGDIELAAMGIILKVERLPLNIGIGICLGMMPLIAYNYSAKNSKRMYGFFTAARLTGIVISLISVVLYWVFAPYIMQLFIDDAQTVGLGTAFLKARCFAAPVMFLSFNMVHFMQAVGRGKISFYLAFIRQLCLNIPILFLLNHLFGMDGIIWTQLTADTVNVIISYIIYHYIKIQLNKETAC